MQLAQRYELSADENSLSETSKQSLAHLALEGIIPSPELMHDIQLLDKGQLTKDQFLERAIARAKA